MKILILGAAGMLGHKMFQVLRERFPDTHGTIHGSVNDGGLAAVSLLHDNRILAHVDAQNFPMLAALLRRRQPDVIVNCVGVIKQRSEAKDAIPSITINALLPHRLADVCSEWGGRLIHFSTDCVFSGRRGSYTEDDTSDAEDLYGKSKYLGEVAPDNALTLRTSIIGRELKHHHSLLDWFLNQNNSTVQGYKRALYSGVTTNHLAEIVGDIIEYHPKLSGLYQVTGRTISKYDLLCVLREAFRLNVEIIPNDTFACDRSMKGDKFQQATGYLAPPWTELAAQLATDNTPYQEWRTENAILNRQTSTHHWRNGFARQSISATPA